MIESVRPQAREVLDREWIRREIADESGIKCEMLRKAINQGRLHESGRVEQRVVAVANWPVDSDKCGRSDEDASAEMGTACTRPDGSVLTALGMLKAALMRFEARRE